MKKKIYDFIYALLLIVGVVAGIYGVGYESTIKMDWSDIGIRNANYYISCRICCYG